jgi:hypothetical protein
VVRATAFAAQLTTLDRINTAAAGYNQGLLERLSEPGIDELRSLITHLSQAIHELVDAERQPGE